MKKPTGDFFRTPTEASQRKQRIVVKYHAAWSQVLRSRIGSPGPERDLAYVDLFAGPGKYTDGTLSTPLLILEAAARDAYMREHLRAHFNEGDPDVAQDLESNIRSSEAAHRLRHFPQVTCALVENDILQSIGGIPRCPLLLFADPWGYKGLSVTLLSSFLRPWGNDLIFFFNYNRIASGLHANVLEEPIDEVFGTKVATDLRRRIVSNGLKGAAKEGEIMNALGEAFAPFGAQTPVQFPFQTKGRLSHHLMFISKNPLGNEIMKGVMSGESTRGCFGFDQAAEIQPLLFTNLLVEGLASKLIQRFAGKTVRFTEIGFDKDPQLGKPDYKKAIQQLEGEGKVIVLSYEKVRRIVKDGLSVSDDAILLFSRGENDGT